MIKPKEILMWTDDAFSTPYIVTADTRLEAAKIVARYRGEDLAWVKRTYQPMELDEIVRLGPDAQRQWPDVYRSATKEAA